MSTLLGLGFPILLGAIILFLVIFVAKRYRKCPPNRIMVVYGKSGSGRSAKCLHGGGCFVWPVLQDHAYLSLEPISIKVDLSGALSLENIRVDVPSTVTVAISRDTSLMTNAADRLLGMREEEVERQAADIIFGQMRDVIATMSIEEINRDRTVFVEKVDTAISAELKKVGMELVNVNVTDISDESGYIKALGKKAASEAIATATIDVAEQEKRGSIGVSEREGDQRARVAELNAQAEVSEQQALRDKANQIAELEADKIQASNKAAEDIARSNATLNVAQAENNQRSTTAEQDARGAIAVSRQDNEKKAAVARAEAEEARLHAELIVPATAEREKATIQAEADKQVQVTKATAESEAIRLVQSAEAEGIEKVLTAKSDGYKKMLATCEEHPDIAVQLMVVEKMEKVAQVGADALANLKIDRVTVLGGHDAVAGLGNSFLNTVPGLYEIAETLGIKLPGWMGERTSLTDGEEASSRVEKETVVAGT